MANDDRTKIIPGERRKSAAMLANVKRAMAITANLNRLTFNDADEIRALFSDLIGKKVDDSFLLIPPFYTTGGSTFGVYGALTSAAEAAERAAVNARGYRSALSTAALSTLEPKALLRIARASATIPGDDAPTFAATTRLDNVGSPRSRSISPTNCEMSPGATRKTSTLANNRPSDA